MEKQEVIDLMLSSTDEETWNDNCDKVKKACHGYPSFWYKEIIIGGVHKKVFLSRGYNIQIQSLAGVVARLVGQLRTKEDGESPLSITDEEGVTGVLCGLLKEVDPTAFTDED